MDSKEAAARSRAQADMDRYHDVLAAYAEGDVASAIGQLAVFDRERLSRTLGSVNRRGVDRHAPWDGRRYALAVMLHTDAGLQFAGETYGGEMYDCLQAAADLLQLGAQCAPDTIRPLAPRWYVGLSRLFRDRAVLHAAEALLGLGRVRLADEARERVRAYAAGPPGRAQEPFWWYVLEPPGAADARMDALRAVVRR